MPEIEREKLPEPQTPSGIAPDSLVNGIPVDPLTRLRTFSADEWEDFVLEWAHSLKDKYSRVERIGQSGDMGRDVAAIYVDGEDDWDCFQCKHYNRPLQPQSIWVELGKLIYYSYLGEYVFPKKCYFVAPQGVGTKLSKLLGDPARLKKELKGQWHDKCRKKITSTKEVVLNSDLLEYIDSLDFGAFDSVPQLELVEQHSRTKWHTYRFGGGLPPRPEDLIPPPGPTLSETTYVRALLDAYAEHLGTEPIEIDDLRAVKEEIQEHFQDSRLEFYSAETLRMFSRDNLPQGEFEKLQDEIHSGIRDEVRRDHVDAYERVLEVVKTARVLQITGHPLVPRMAIRDRGGICHQLANDDEVRWVK